ncbi:RNA polymerase sigma factor [Echinicola strongylocentroti]|uniref:RNA polymerase sigma factor n=1 Tax=Echinicola strongylocentroti TaxID=1795355 RepID=A0A2Z4IHU5_9BACT|nr:RNA polymerase sigma factor [Echinicola strongylocentroti]AWW30534.1 RNA polymerase sigma factor [Echinicola strongylocentroti]
MTNVEFSYSLNEHSKSLRPFAMRLTKDMDDANDLVQETMLKAYTNRDKFSDGTNLRAWLYTIMKNTFFTRYQRMLRRGTFVDTTDNLHYINSGDFSIENKAHSKFALDDIYKCIGALNSAYKVPFMMYFKGFKYQEIADELNLPIGTVKNRIHLARKTLKGDLKVYKTN